jgi:hypothetical protein
MMHACAVLTVRDLCAGTYDEGGVRTMTTSFSYCLTAAAAQTTIFLGVCIDIMCGCGFCDRQI